MVALIIMDGFGIRRSKYGNAIKAANTPNIDFLLKNYPNTTLFACEGAVGLPRGQEGNSEAGHINMGAGRTIKQDVVRIDEAIESGEFDKNAAILLAIDNAKKNNKSLHLLGLCSDGGLHAKITHLKQILKLAKERGLKNVYLHLFTDGRDTPIDSGVKYIDNIEKFIKRLGVGKIATIGGRVYGMDREKRYDRLKLAYDAIVYGVSKNNFATAKECLETSYKNGVFDEFVEPSVIDGGKQIESGDSVIFYNYRTDRAREMTDAISQSSFDKFKTKELKNLTYVCMTQYDKTFKDVLVAFPPEKKTPPLGKVLSDAGLKQFRCSETTKYAHVTFFFNGGEEIAYPGEDRKLIETKNLKNFASFPQMRAYEIAETVGAAIESKKYDFVLTNLSNCDMIGHTGDFDATVKAVESVDRAVGIIYSACKKAGCDFLLTADHGNADDMLTKDGKPITSHSMSKVPFVVVSDKFKNINLREDGELTDISPTVLKMLGVEIPTFFTRKPLF